MNAVCIGSRVPFGIRQFRRMLLFCLLQDATISATEMLSSMLAGNFLGEEALAGVALAMPVQLVIRFVAYLIGCGMLTMYLHRRGRLDREGAETVFSQAVWMALASGVALAAAIGFGRDAYIAFMGPTAAVAEHAREYWRFLPPLALLAPLEQVVLYCALGDGRGGLVGLASGVRFAVAVGIALALFAGHSGVAAGSVALTVATVASALTLGTHFFSADNTFRLRWRLRPGTWVAMVATAFGDASAALGDAIVVFMLGGTVSTMLGPSALALLPIVPLMIQIGEVSTGISGGMQPVITVYAGERNWAAIRLLVGDAMRMIAGFSLVVTAVLLAFPEIALAMLGIREATLAAAGTGAVRWTVLAMFPLVLSNFLNNYYQCVEHEGLSVLTSALGWFVLPIAALAGVRWVDPDLFWSWFAAAKWAGLGILLALVAWRYGRRRFPWLIDRGREAKIRVISIDLKETAIVHAACEIAETVDGIADHVRAMRASLLVEETLLVVRDRNAGQTVHAEVTLDWNEGVRLTLRDDGIIFDITDADAEVSGLRTYLVASMMGRQSEKQNILTTGFNRNVFKL